MSKVRLYKDGRLEVEDADGKTRLPIFIADYNEGDVHWEGDVQMSAAQVLWAWPLWREIALNAIARKMMRDASDVTI